MKHNVIQQTLLAIASKHKGNLTPAAVIRAAKNKNSVLHSLFTWEDTEAAKLWRLHEARNLILRINVTVETKPTQTITVKAWSSLTTARGRNGGYRETIKLLKHPNAREQLLKDALAELRAFETKYRALSELSDIFAAIDKLHKS